MGTKADQLARIVDRLDADERRDALVNPTTRLGTSDDVQLQTRVVAGREMIPDELDLILRTSTLAHVEIWRMADDLVRKGIKLENVQPANLDLSALQSYLEGDLTPGPDGLLARERGLLWYVTRLIGMGDGLGGAVLIPLIDDGLDPALPLDVRRIEKIDGWVVLDRREITPYSLTGLEPEYYVLSGARREIQMGDVYHRSRVWVHDGIPVSEYFRRVRGWWGQSKLQLTQLERVGADSALQYLLGYMHRTNWLAYTMAGLNELLGQLDEDGNEIGESDVQVRMQAMRRAITTFGMAILDGGMPEGVDESGAKLPGRNPDKIASVAESISGLPEIHEAALQRWLIATGMPRSIALGEGANGIRGGDNKGDWQAWEGKCDARRIKDVTPLLQWALVLIFASRKGPTQGVIPQSYTIAYNRLVELTDEEKAKLDLTVAEADGMRITQRVVHPAEVRQQRLVNGDRTGPLRADGAMVSTAPELLVGLADKLLQGALAVQAGQLSPEVFGRLVPIITRGAASTEEAAELQRLLTEFPARAPAPVPGVSTPAAASVGDEVDEVADDEAESDETELGEVEEPDPLDFSTDAPPPGGVESARAIVDKLHARGFSTVTVRQVKRLARQGEIRAWSMLGREPAFSLAEVAAVLRKRIQGGMQPSGEAPPAAVAQDAAEPDLTTIYGWLVEHYSHTRKLSAPRIQTLLGLREKHSFLRPPAAARLYRGLYNVSPARAGRLAGPTSPVRDKSWTTRPEVADRFARGEFVKPEQIDTSLLGVVLEADADPEYMLLDAEAIADLPEVGGVVNKIWGMPLAESIREEAEVLVLGSLDVDQLRVLRYSDT